MAGGSTGNSDRPKSRARRSSAKGGVDRPEAEAHPDTAQARRTAAGLTYNEARSALDLILAELQSSSLDVEQMAGLHRRAQAYAERCEQILEEVEQEILVWDPSTDADPVPYTP
jgi:exodeoxyribonuclease VII small subunit